MDADLYSRKPFSLGVADGKASAHICLIMKIVEYPYTSWWKGHKIRLNHVYVWLLWGREGIEREFSPVIYSHSREFFFFENRLLILSNVVFLAVKGMRLRLLINILSFK